jgi:hypothetical protein
MNKYSNEQKIYHVYKSDLLMDRLGVVFYFIRFDHLI